MSTDTAPAQSAGIWRTFNESPTAVKAIFAGVFINRLGAFLSIFVVLFMTSKGRSPSEAAFALGAYGAGGVIGVLIGGMLADRLGAPHPPPLRMSSPAGPGAPPLYPPDH